MIFKLKFHHLGLAVKKEDSAILFLKGMGYIIGDKIYDPEQNVNLQLCTAKNQPSIEIIMPGIGDGPLTPILNRYNELIYHSCFEVENLKKTLQTIEESGLRIIPMAEPKPAILFNGRKVSFYNVMGFGLIELLEK